MRELSSLLVVPSINLLNPIPDCNCDSSPVTVILSFPIFTTESLSPGNGSSGLVILATAFLEFKLLSTTNASLNAKSKLISLLAFKVIVARVSVPLSLTFSPILVNTV